MSIPTINHHEHPVGSVVYFIEKKRYGDEYIWFGIVDENYAKSIAVKYIVVKQRRYVDGVPEEEVITPSKWHKLPKDWSYDTELFKVTYDDVPDEVANANLKDPAEILDLYQKGYLIDSKDKDFSTFHSRVDYKQGWQLVREYPTYSDSHPDYTTLELDNVFDTYEEAKVRLDEINAEYKRIADMSDYDWSVWQIDKVIDQWAKIYSKTDEEKKRVRDFILAQDDVENIEARLVHTGVQWKYEGKKKWQDITLV